MARQSPRTLDGEAHYLYWWAALPAIPRFPSSLSYNRLRRVWRDPTWKSFVFANPEHELHLTATLWENFEVLDAALWLPQLLEAAGLPSHIGTVSAARWSYEFEIRTGASGCKLADVVLHAHDDRGELLIIVEAKARGGPLKPADVDPGSYLDLEPFRFCDRRFLLYLVDEDDLLATRTAIIDAKHRHGILTWQQLAAIQISAALQLTIPDKLREFMAGSIHYQFCQHDIRPPAPFSYLGKEPPFSTIPRQKPDSQSIEERTEELWRLDD